MIRIPALSLVATLLAAQAPAPKPKTVPVPKAADPSKPKQDPVLATLGRTVVRQSDFDTFLRLVYNEAQRNQISTTPGAIDRVKAGYLDSLVMAAKARKIGLNKTSDFKKQMEYAEIRVLATALGENIKDELKKKTEVSDEDLKAYYDKNQAQFQSKGSFDARHILVSVKGSQPGGDKGLSDEEAKAKVAKAQADLKAGKSWQDVAKDYSDDPGSKDKGGLYENIAYGSFVPEFEEVVRKQDLGKPGEPVKSKFGYHIIQVEKRTEPVLQPFEKVKEQVRPKVVAAKQEEARKTYMDAFRKEVGFVEGAATAKKGAKAPAKKGR